MLLAGGMSNAWCMESNVAQEARVAQKARAAELARLTEDARVAEEARMAARTAHEDAAKKLDQVKTQKKETTKKLGAAEGKLAELVADPKKTVAELRAEHQNQELLAPHGQETMKLEQAIKLKEEIAKHEETIKGHEAEEGKHEKTISEKKIEEATHQKTAEERQKSIEALKKLDVAPKEEKFGAKPEEKLGAKEGKEEGLNTFAEKWAKWDLAGAAKTMAEIWNEPDPKKRELKMLEFVTKSGQKGMGAGGYIGIISAILATVGTVVGTVVGAVEANKTAAGEQATISGEQASNQTMFEDLLNAIVTPNANPKADPNDEDYNKTLGDVVSLFTNFDQDLKQMLETSSDYTAKSIQFQAGEVDIDGTQVAVSIRWDMEQTELGMPLTPVLITLFPDGLRGFAITPADIMGKLDDGPAKDALAMILKPTASLIFTIKLIQLCNLASKTYPDKDIANIEYTLDEATKLYSRFILSTNEDTTPDALNSYLQQYPSIVEVLNNKTVKVYQVLADDIDTPLEQQKTAFMSMQKSGVATGPLLTAIKTFYNHFYQIYYKKFKNDDGYVTTPFTPGARATKNMLQAIFYRGLRDVVRAAQELSEAEGQVTLRYLDGTTRTVNPKLDINSLIATPASTLATASITLKNAATGIKKIIDAAKAAKEAVQSKNMQSAKAAYEKAIENVKAASSATSNALLQFRKKNAPFYPLTWDSGISLTPAEFMVANIKNLYSADPVYVKNNITTIYNPFIKELGIPVAQFMPQPAGSTQGSATLNKVVGYATSAFKPVNTTPAKSATTAASE